jgi:hypothetical protein
MTGWQTDVLLHSQHLLCTGAAAINGAVCTLDCYALLLHILSVLAIPEAVAQTVVLFWTTRHTWAHPGAATTATHKCTFSHATVIPS